MNGAKKIITKQLISKGGRAGTIADPKIIFQIALEHQASSLILTHNHPSGNTAPSQADILLTRKLCSAGKMLDLSILDHLIFTDSAYFSFADEGLIDE